MIGINSNINSLVAQQNLNNTQSALSSAITRLSSGKRINSAADDAAGLAISTRMTTQINGLNQSVSNANDAVSMLQTASSGLSQITDNLQRIRQLAVQASTGSMSSSDQAALQKEVSQRIAEVNRISSQTTYNGTNVLDGSAGVKSFQIGANVGQSINVDLSSSMSADKVGGGTNVAKGSLLGTVDVALDSSGAAWSSSSTGAETTSINVYADGAGGFTFKDQNGTDATTQAGAFFGSTATAAGTGTASTPAFTSLSAGGSGVSATTGQSTEIAAINANNKPPKVAQIDISTTNGATAAIESIDDALTNVNNLQASIGAAQNRFSSVAATQTAQSTNLSSAQSQITDANFAQETANLSKAQVLQQAGISVLAQANSMPQQVLKLLG
ncbi:Flagellar biosynthesis protein FliC [Candidatus Burkholderia verschuerenii]|uniref:Flagellin n=1 Tax=Candidatus Burkholderia verschuerenii TaxID=242163 RepID=A0A0L0MGA2_9BURK|nr:flagellin [Candidatus Burkholderia verschuerenii]KND61353.1 Flagellar biosynthesis protein FliC [Candidatus Burkholderia verschuerenii]